MSIISAIMKKRDQLETVATTLMDLASSVQKLANAVASLTQTVREQEILLSEIYVVQTYILRTLQLDVSDVTDVGLHESHDRKTEKPN